MDQITPMPGHGLLIPGHSLPPGKAVDAAAEWLVAHGADEWSIGDALPNARPLRAWWSPYSGFVGQDWDEGVPEPVIVVHLPDHLITPEAS